MAKSRGSKDSEKDTTSKTTLKKSELEFVVQSGTRTKDRIDETRTFYFDLDDNNKPIKVGDGTFGVVFRVSDASDKLHAVKLLYEAKSTKYGEAKSDLIKERFEYEAQACEDIRKNLKQSNNQVEHIPIIQPIGWTRDFQGSPAYTYLDNCGAFAQFDLQVSNYGMVTELYDGTLKDLLEKNSDTISVNRRLNGYKVLDALDFSSRFCTIKPFLSKIAEGLVELHRACKCHLDLKPANIYYKCTPNEFDVVIGDLGFIGQPQLAGTATSPEEVALGTRHYRSPEQKDFLDSCEVDVEPIDDARKDSVQFKVVVNDPKFWDTIIEPGDALVFCKDTKRNEYIVKKINWDEKKKQAEITFDDSKNMKKDKNTQVVMYKRQATRTDIFGFGALIFDMITCGRSPERFYDYLRAEDSRSKTVDTIREKYRQVSTFSAKDPDYVNMFSSFRHQNGQEYAPLEIVEMILKCMLYQTKGTLYNDNVDKPDRTNETQWKAMDAALKELNDLESKYPSIWIKDQNPLMVNQEKPKLKLKREGIDDEIKEMRQMGFSMMRARCGFAAIRYRQLIKLVQQTTQDKVFYLAEMTPENIFLRSDTSDKPGFSIAIYNDFKDYKDDLLSDVVYTKVFYNQSNPYSSDALGYLRRKITLTPENSFNGVQSESSTDGKIFSIWQYEFEDSSPLGDYVSVNDWIVIQSNQSKQLYQVVRIEKNANIELKFISKSESSVVPGGLIDPVTSSITGIYYRNINTADYYLASLGVYLYQAFFVGLGSNTISEPSIIQSYKANFRGNLSEMKNIYVKLRKPINCLANNKKRRNKVPLIKLYERLTALYLVLSLPYPSEFFLHDPKRKQNETILDTLSGTWSGISRDIEECFEFTQDVLTDYDSGNIQKIKQYDNLVLDCENEELNISRFIKKQLR